MTERARGKANRGWGKAPVPPVPQEAQESSSTYTSLASTSLAPAGSAAQASGDLEGSARDSLRPNSLPEETVHDSYNFVFKLDLT